MARFLSEGQMYRWRILSQIPGWDITKPFSDKAKQQLSQLKPPFIPRNESLIFDVGICNGWGCPDCTVTQVVYRNINLKDGYFFATESRLIFGHVKQNIVAQILYENIEAIYGNPGQYSIVLEDGSEVIIRVRIPRPSVMKFLGGIAAPPGVQQDILREQERINASGWNFHNSFSGFFTQIADINRKRRLQE